SQWMSKSRDSRRISDLGQIEKAISISYIKKEDTKYPSPDNVVKVVMGDGGVLWNQGEFGETMLNYTDTLQKMPKDPDGSSYVYSVSADNKYYELLTLLENERNLASIISNTYAYGKNNSFVLTNFDGYLLVFTGTFPSQTVTLVQTPTILVNPELLSGVEGTFVPDMQEDIIVRDGLIAAKPNVLTGDVSTFFDGDDSNNGTAQNDIISTFPGLDNSKFAQIIKKGGASGVVDNGEELEEQVGSCAAQDLLFNNGPDNQVTFHFDALGNGQVGTGRANIVTDPNGDYYDFQLGRCTDGTLTFIEDTWDTACVNSAQQFDKNLWKCVSPCGGDVMPPNTYTEASLDGHYWEFDYDKEWPSCSYRCSSGYYFEMSEDPGCKQSKCQGNIPDFAYIYGEPDETWINFTREFFDDEGNMPADSTCKFKCKTGYDFDGTSCNPPSEVPQ
ncbi:MAG: hypothetical protein V3575_03395, partial [Candidatus Absconditabacteria bacterium]